MYKILKFSAGWCGPCKMLSNTISKLPDEKRAKIEEIDIDACGSDLLNKYSVRGVPTMVVLDKDGRVMKTIVGNVPLSKFEEWL